MKAITIVFFVLIIAISGVGVYYYIQMSRYEYQDTRLLRTDKVTGIVEAYNDDSRTWLPIK